MDCDGAHSLLQQGTSYILKWVKYSVDLWSSLFLLPTFPPPNLCCPANKPIHSRWGVETLKAKEASFDFAQGDDPSAAASATRPFQ